MNTHTPKARELISELKAAFREMPTALNGYNFTTWSRTEQKLVDALSQAFEQGREYGRNDTVSFHAPDPASTASDITDEQIDAAYHAHHNAGFGRTDTYTGIRAFTRRILALAAPTAQPVGQKPYAYCVYIAAEQRGELVYDLEDAMDDLSNCECEITELFDHPPAPAAPSLDAQDAARYRWLRDPETNLDALAADNWKDGEVYSGDELDHAIDAALAASTKGEGS